VYFPKYTALIHVNTRVFSGACISDATIKNLLIHNRRSQAGFAFMDRVLQGIDSARMIVLLDLLQ
jgi:uncharacterized protein (DUF3084 family)